MHSTKLDEKVANELMGNIMSSEASLSFRQDLLFNLNLAYAGKAYKTIQTESAINLLLNAGLVESHPDGRYTASTRGKSFIEKQYAGQVVMGIRIP